MSVLDQELPFQFWTELSMFEKSDAAPGQRRRVAGIMSTEECDQQGETLLQDGMDFSYLLSKGYFNDNHDKTTDGIIGYPEQVQRFRRGETLPDGTIAKSNCTWVEGRLLENDERATKVWNKGLALKGTPRSLGFSVQGKSRARTQDGKTVIKSEIQHCAITAMPVNATSRTHLFMKSLVQAASASPDNLEAAWTAFAKSLEPEASEPEIITKTRAVNLVEARYPGISKENARRVVETICRRLEK